MTSLRDLEPEQFPDFVRRLLDRVAELEMVDALQGKRIERLNQAVRVLCAAVGIPVKEPEDEQ